jgi:hypothetical protein
MYVKCNSEACSCNHCCSGKTIYIFSMCFKLKASSLHSACAILSFLACPALLYFFTLFHKWHDLKKTLNIKLVFWFSVQFAWSISHSEKNLTKYNQNENWCLYTLPVILNNRFNETFIFLIDFRKKSNIKNHKNSPRGSCSTQTDGRLNIKKLIIALRNFVNAHIIFQ